MNIKDIARRYDMDEKALTAHLAKLQTGYKAKQKEYDELPDRKAYQEHADKLKMQVHRLRTTLKDTPQEMRHYLAGDYPINWVDHLEAELEHLYQQARHMTAKVSGRKVKFHRNWLALRLLQTFKALSTHPPTKDRLTGFMSDVSNLWGIDPKGWRHVIRKLREQGVK